jgi:hypothetical protein
MAFCRRGVVIMGSSGIAMESDEKSSAPRGKRREKIFHVWKWILMLMFTWIPIIGAIILTMVMVKTDKPDVKRFCIANLIMQTVAVILIVILAARMSGFIVEMMSQ